MSEQLTLPDASATARCGHRLGTAIRERPTLGALIGLSGDLGAGKTSLVAATLAACGVTAPVRSPTYTLLEPYVLPTVPPRHVYHLDLYRLRSALELDDLGVRELLDGQNVLLVEWVENAPELERLCDLRVRLEYAKPGRTLQLEAHTATGRLLASALLQQ